MLRSTEFNSRYFLLYPRWASAAADEPDRKVVFRKICQRFAIGRFYRYGNSYSAWRTMSSTSLSQTGNTSAFSSSLRYRRLICRASHRSCWRLSADRLLASRERVNATPRRLPHQATTMGCDASFFRNYRTNFGPPNLPGPEGRKGRWGSPMTSASCRRNRPSDSTALPIPDYPLNQRSPERLPEALLGMRNSVKRWSFTVERRPPDGEPR